MESKILSAIGIDPGMILIVMLCLIAILFYISIHTMMKYNRLKASYHSFMRGNNGKNLEECIFERFDGLDEVMKICKKNQESIKELNKNTVDHYQKVGILRYDAFHEMGGKLSFALVLLDGNNNGFILNSMHSREGCYNYIKEIVNGESYIELSEEEAEALDQAIYQETLEFEMDHK